MYYGNSDSREYDRLTRKVPKFRLHDGRTRTTRQTVSQRDRRHTF